MNYIIYIGPGIGDMMIVMPMLKAIKTYDNYAVIRIITRSSRSRFSINKKIFKLQEYADSFDYYSPKEHIKTLCFLLKNGIKKFNYGFSLQYTNTKNTSVIPSILLRLAAHTTIGMKISEKPSIKYDYYVEFESGKTMSDYSLLLINKIGLPSEVDMTRLIRKDKLPTIVFHKEIAEHSDFISLCIGTAQVSMKLGNKIISNNSKMWPYENWIALAELLCKAGYVVILLGGNDEKNALKKIDMRYLNNRIINYVGRCDILESMSILNMSSLVVGADTGLMHCAGALGVKTLTLFGCTDFKEYLPMGEHSYYIASDEPCSPCFGLAQSVLCEHHNCMKHITVEQVLNKVLDLQK